MRKFFILAVALLSHFSLFAADFGKEVRWDSQSLLIDGHRVVPVMGEIHYSRIPAGEWQREIRKMKEGGVTIIATYVFWNHVEEEEGNFRWDGQRNLRRFLELCKQEQMPVVLRLGPFCHGEVRNGGIPDWMFSLKNADGKSVRMRSEEPLFLQRAERLYRQIFTQVQGLQWKDGGPVIAAQFDNEYRGRGSYLMALKKIATGIGFDLPFYTRTGWPELSTPVPFGEMIPLYGDYADGFWDKDITECAGSYYQAFNFKAFRSSTAIGTDLLGKQEAKTSKGDEQYPYFTCELGGGMVTAYHRRPFIYPDDCYSLAVVKLGSGSNLLGYYMYHGGTNPEGKLHTLNECQTSPATANNDLPVCTYDFQAPLGEFGQAYPQYFRLRPLHLFMHDFGELLAPMDATFPAPQNITKGDDRGLRWSYRSKDGQGFIFINNYERLQQLSTKKDVQLEACGVTFPKLTIPAATICVFPVNIEGIRYATAQLVAKRNDCIYLQQVAGIPTTLCIDGKTLKNVKPQGTKKPVCRSKDGKAYYLLTAHEAERLFLSEESLAALGEGCSEKTLSFTKIKAAGAPRQIVKGRAKVAEAPADTDFEQAAIYKIQLDGTTANRLLRIHYRGDCARLYANGKLVADNFYYGRPFLFGLWRLPAGCKELELRILPLQPDAPIYLPREADKTAGEELRSVEWLALEANKSTTTAQVIDLSGEWEFQTGDSTPPTAYTDRITLPGSMLTNGKGNPVNVNTPWTGSLYDSSYYFNPAMEKYRIEGQMKFPFFLTPEKHYIGHAWYRKTVRIPKTWKRQQVFLHLERPHIETTLYINNVKVGHQMSLSVPHDYDITNYLRPGQENEIAICIYNGIENVCVGQDSHSVTDQTQGNWNGIVGRMELRTTPLIQKIRVIPDIKAKTVKILVNEAEYNIFMGEDVELWDEFHPRLYTRQVIYKGAPVDVTFGMREISIRDRQFYMNGKPVWMRGTVENCCFPLTGYPPTDVESWVQIFRKCKEYGLNHMRFHSYCPPEAAFVAADSLGFYLQPEGPSWPNHGVKLRRGMSIDQYLLDEGKAIVDRYGHHPSFVMMAAGNEPAGDWVSYCNDWVKEMKQYDPTKVYCGASVGGGWAWDSGSEYHVKGGARGLDWDKQAPHSDDDYFDQIEFPRNYKPVPSEKDERGANHSPILAHEQGQWCAFPDLEETSQYTGAYKARNFEIFADLLAKNGMASQAGKFLYASGRLQTTAYKYEIERNLRTRDYAGFQLLALNDYSGQGTALEGVLNVFWREKNGAYTNAREWREFCSPIVPLARFPKFVFESNEHLVIPVEVYNASGSDLHNIKCRYTIEASDNEQGAKYEGTFDIQTIPLGKNNPIGTVETALTSLTSSLLPLTYSLTLSIEDDKGEIARNHWQFWVYPQQEEKSETTAARGEIFTSDTLDSQVLDVLQKGGTVLLTAAGKVSLGSDVKQTYLPVFWNTSWFKMRPPHTTGAYIDNRHPLFAHGFPTGEWSDLNWWELLNKAQVMNLMELPADYQPPIQPIDTWHVSRKLGMLIEARVLNGRLLMTTMDITRNLDRRPVARQMRRAILDYMQSADFQPTLRIEPETVSHFFTHEAPPVNMFTNDSPDELKPKIK